MLKIVKDIDFLRQTSEEVTNEEAIEIIPKLEEALIANRNCIGLCAINIGIPKRIFVLKNGDEIEHYVNPELIEANGEFQFKKESSISLPNVQLETNRFYHYMVKYTCFDIDEGLQYPNISVDVNSVEHVRQDSFISARSGSAREETSYFYYPETESEHQKRQDSLIAIAVQHQMDQLDGKILIDYGIAKPKKAGRNELCPCGSNKKYKKCCGR